MLDRLEKARLIAPPGPVDKVLETVVNNLRVTNHLDGLPPVQCRVMMTSSLESFSLAYTIVLSRGLIDVLPDEASLAMVLAHELAHIALGHKLDPKFAFNDRLIVSDEQLLAALDFTRPYNDLTAFVLGQWRRMPRFLAWPVRIATLVFALNGLAQGALFHRLAPHKRFHQLESWRLSRLAPRRGFVRFYRSLALLALYSRPGTQEE